MKKQNKKIIEKIKRISLPILKKNGVIKAGIFGSYATGNFTKKSDIDILAKIPKNVSLYDFVGIKLGLENALKKKVDLVEYCTIKPRIKNRILKEEIKII